MENMGQQINSVIDNIATKLGVTVDKLYPILMKQAYIDGILSIVYCIIISLLMITPYIIYKKILKGEEVERFCDLEDDSQVAIVTISIIVSLIFIFVVSINFNDIFTALLNPEYYIINNLRKGM